MQQPHRIISKSKQKEKNQMVILMLYLDMLLIIVGLLKMEFIILFKIN
jgi:predicted nucleic acid-binding Zn ribbon protein